MILFTDQPLSNDDNTNSDKVALKNSKFQLTD